MIPEAHTYDSITENITLVLNKWGIEYKTCAFICHNAPNMIKAVVTMVDILLMRCVAHSVQLSVNAGLQNHIIKELISKIRTIFGHFHLNAVSQIS